MIFSVNGLLSILAAYVNVFTLASVLQLSTESTRRYAQFAVVQAAMLYSFAYAVIPKKLPCLVATALFFVFEMKNAVGQGTEAIKSSDDA